MYDPSVVCINARNYSTLEANAMWSNNSVPNGYLFLCRYDKAVDIMKTLAKQKSRLNFSTDLIFHILIVELFHVTGLC